MTILKENQESQYYLPLLRKTAAYRKIENCKVEGQNEESERMKVEAVQKRALSDESETVTKHKELADPN